MAFLQVPFTIYYMFIGFPGLEGIPGEPGVPGVPGTNGLPGILINQIILNWFQFNFNWLCIIQHQLYVIMHNLKTNFIVVWIMTGFKGNQGYPGVPGQRGLGMILITFLRVIFTTFISF